MQIKLHFFTKKVHFFTITPRWQSSQMAVIPLTPTLLIFAPRALVARCVARFPRIRYAVRVYTPAATLPLREPHRAAERSGNYRVGGPLFIPLLLGWSRRITAHTAPCRRAPGGLPSFGVRGAREPRRVLCVSWRLRASLAIVGVIVAVPVALRVRPRSYTDAKRPPRSRRLYQIDKERMR